MGPTCSDKGSTRVTLWPSIFCRFSRAKLDHCLFVCDINLCFMTVVRPDPRYLLNKCLPKCMSTSSINAATTLQLLHSRAFREYDLENQLG